MVAKVPDQHHGGLGPLEDGRNGLNAPNIVRLGGPLKETNSTYCFGGLKERLWIHFMLKFVKQLTDVQHRRV